MTPRFGVRRILPAGLSLATLLAPWVAAAPDPASSSREVFENPALGSAPSWPEERARISAETAGRLGALLDRFLAENPRDSRATEARVRRALLRLEPLAGRDPRRGRAELTGATQAAPDDPWVPVARYALAALDEEEGDFDRAFDRYHRIYLESGDAKLSARAASGVGRILLRRGRAGESAGWLQAAVERNTAGDIEAGHLRELAVRCVLSEAGAREFWPGVEPASVPSESKGVVNVLLRGEEAILINASAGELVHLNAAGMPIRRTPLPGVEAATVDPYGRIWAIAEGGVVRLEDGSPTEVLAPGELASPTALAVDAAGRLYLADRRGDRVQVVEPGDPAVRTLRERKGGRITALAWDGIGIVALESGLSRLVRFDAAGGETVVVEGIAESPSHASAVGSGHVAVADAKTGQVVLLSPDGRVVARAPRGTVEATRATRLALRSDGSLYVLDDRGGRWTRLP